MVAFIHDEILVELPDDGEYEEEVAVIRQVVCGSMQELTGTVPIDCELSVARSILPLSLSLSLSFYISLDYPLHRSENSLPSVGPGRKLLSSCMTRTARSLYGRNRRAWQQSSWVWILN